jgi:hypothetical protein
MMSFTESFHNQSKNNYYTYDVNYNSNLSKLKSEITIPVPQPEITIPVPQPEITISAPQPEITITTFSGKNLKPITFDPKMTVSDLKDEIFKNEYHSQFHQRIIYAGKELEDFRTLEEYKITDKSKVFLILKLVGGMMHPSSGKKDYNNINF